MTAERDTLDNDADNTCYVWMRSWARWTEID